MPSLPLIITTAFGTLSNATGAQLDANLTVIYQAVNGIGNGSTSLSNVNISGGLVSNITIDGGTINISALANSGSSGNVLTSNGTAWLSQAPVSSPTAPWAVWNANLTAGSGTFSNASVAALTTNIGKTVFIEARISISTAGSASVPTLSLPIQAANSFYVIPAQEVQSTGLLWQGVISPNANTVQLRNYLNSGTTADGTAIVINGVYQSV